MNLVVIHIRETLLVSTGAAREDRKGLRIAYVDNLRALMTTLVLLTHVAVTYSGMGSCHSTSFRGRGLSGSRSPYRYAHTLFPAFPSRMGSLVLVPAEKGCPVEYEYTLASIFPGEQGVFNAIVVFQRNPFIPLELS